MVECPISRGVGREVGTVRSIGVSLVLSRRLCGFVSVSSVFVCVFGLFEVNGGALPDW